MTGITTYGVQPTPEIIVEGLLRHASLPLAALVFLAGLLLGSPFQEPP